MQAATELCRNLEIEMLPTSVRRGQCRRKPDDDVLDTIYDVHALQIIRRPRPPTKTASAELQTLLEALEAPAIDDETRARLLKFMERHGKEHVTLLVRTIIESQCNENALTAPIINAVSLVMVFHPAWPSRGLFWIEAFDRLPLNALLQTMLGLDLFEPTTISRYLFMVLRNKLWDVFEPPARHKAKRNTYSGGI